MCGSLKHSHWASKDPIKLGDYFPAGVKIEVEGESITNAKWNGFARNEKISNWIKHGWKEGTLKVEEFTEQGKIFKVSDNESIKVLIRAGETNYLNILTRAANKNNSEEDIHPRWPTIIED